MINGKKVVALCTYRIHEPQEFAFISELSENLKSNNCHLFIYALNSEIGIATDTSPEIEVFDLIPYDKIDVVVIMNEKIKVRDVSQSIIDRASSNNIPVVVVDGEFENVSMVSYGDFWALPCRAATQEILKRDVLPDSIICANDIMAINVCDVLSEAGIRVPEDVIVSGFDGIDEAFLSTPGITTAVCVRTGGDEMLALLIGDYDIDEILPEIEKKLQQSSDELGFKVSASIGTSSLPYKRGEETISKAIGLADERMYVMKRTMKNANKSTAS